LRFRRQARPVFYIENSLWDAFANPLVFSFQAEAFKNPFFRFAMKLEKLDARKIFA